MFDSGIAIVIPSPLEAAVSGCEVEERRVRPALLTLDLALFIRDDTPDAKCVLCSHEEHKLRCPEMVQVTLNNVPGPVQCRCYIKDPSASQR